MMFCQSGEISPNLVTLLNNILYSSFVFDYYSDLELTFEYYNGAFVNTSSNESIPDSGSASGEGCSDITRQPDEYRTAFFTNLCCIAVPLVIFYVMCAREILVRLVKLERRLKASIRHKF